MNIRETIVAHRMERVKREGPELGVRVPAEREVPISVFPAPPGLICEVKRRSPSRGGIAQEIDVNGHIGLYFEGGARSVSVLTEEDHFQGSLTDLVEAKRAFPDVSFLRKDFLVSRGDIDVSYRAGADAILLIASILDPEPLADLYEYASEIGMNALVEIHDADDLRKVRTFKPRCVGCNARNLATFEIDMLEPLALSRSIDWSCSKVFESGVWRGEDARLAAESGFDALLVGESVVRDPSIIPQLVDGFKGGDRRFWTTVAERRPGQPGRQSPLVKICGLTREQDVEAAVGLGADLLGFNFVPESPRCVEPRFVTEIGSTEALKVGIVVSGAGRRVPGPVLDLLSTGALDAIQLHGDEKPDECAEMAVPYYKAVRVASESDLAESYAYHSPRVLIDARSQKAYGGTGRRIPEDLVKTASNSGPLWLAGGINPDNVAGIVREFEPELIDVSSGVESSPGRKDGVKLESLFDRITQA